MSKKLLSFLPLILFLLLVTAVGYLVIGGPQPDTSPPTSPERTSTILVAVEPSLTDTPTTMPTHTSTPTGTATSAATSTPSPILTDTPSPTFTYTPTEAPPTATFTPVPTSTPTVTPIPPSPTPTLTPTIQLQYGPRLYEPKPGAVYAPEDTIWFTWERFNLQPDQYYSLRVVLDVEPEPAACIHIQVQNPAEQSKDPEAYLKPKDHGCQTGPYYWSVVVVTDLSGGNKSEWREDSESNHKNHFGIGMPHPNPYAGPTPGSGGGGTGGLPRPPQ
jgi:hypothetical protein